MNSDELQFVRQTFGWDADTTFNLLQSGENQTYRVDTKPTQYALRRYRPTRYTCNQVGAELAWMDMLRASLPIPGILTNKSGDQISKYRHSSGDTLFVAFQFLEGDNIEAPTATDYRKLGELLRSLHDNAREVMNEASADWEGWNRPEYDQDRTIQAPLYALLNFDALSEDDQDRAVNIAEELTQRYEVVESVRHFVHADLHFGNIIAAQDTWYCLDFDECGFGHPAIDLGVVRLHLLASGQLGDMWQNFQEGYGSALSDAEIRLGSALRIFYMAGKIPLRQDIEALRAKPAERIRRYLGYIESELNTSRHSRSESEGTTWSR